MSFCVLSQTVFVLLFLISLKMFPIFKRLNSFLNVFKFYCLRFRKLLQALISGSLAAAVLKVLTLCWVSQSARSLKTNKTVAGLSSTWNVFSKPRQGRQMLIILRYIHVKTNRCEDTLYSEILLINHWIKLSL